MNQLMDTLTAESARTMTREALKVSANGPMLDCACRRIAEAARAGRREVTHPFHECKAQPWGSHYWTRRDHEEAVFDVLRGRGFTVRHVPNPDPGHPASSDYDEISW